MVGSALPHYEPPVVVTYTDEEILDELGPAETSVYMRENCIHSCGSPNTTH